MLTPAGPAFNAGGEQFHGTETVLAPAIKKLSVSFAGQPVSDIVIVIEVG